jgi:hypothetical protein
MNEEILAGIKNAIAHGFSLEEAANSFINAGNNPSEVKEVVSFISKGISPLPSLSKTTETSVQKEIAAQKEITAKKELATPPKPKASGRLKWILIILAALVVLAGALSFIFFKNKLLGLVIDPIFP